MYIPEMKKMDCSEVYSMGKCVFAVSFGVFGL